MFAFYKSPETHFNRQDKKGRRRQPRRERRGRQIKDKAPPKAGPKAPQAKNGAKAARKNIAPK